MPEIKDPRQLFTYKLGAALTMEQTVLGMLGKLEGQANDEQLKQQFGHHREETERHVQNLEQAFQALGQDSQTQSCPAIEGIAREGDELVQKAAPELVDAVILGGAAETEHHEISVYEGLITKAEAMGEQDVVMLLQENLQQEQHTLEEVRKATQQLAQATV